jgi:small GTP-binding protein
MQGQVAFDNAPNIKVVLLGESSVGKTSIVSVAQGCGYQADQLATVGACFHMKKVRVGDVSMKLHIWDTAGQERFRSLTPMYYRDAHFVVLVYAIDNPESFSAISRWYDGLVTECSTVPHIILIGNKMDLEDDRKVSTEQGKLQAESISAKLYELSAKRSDPTIPKILDEVAEQAARDIARQAESYLTYVNVNTEGENSAPKKCRC